MRVVQGILIGALFSGIVSAIYACYIAFTSNTVSEFAFTAEDFWWLYAIIGGIVGFILGAIVGVIVSGLNFNLILGGLVGLVLTGIPGLLLSQESKFDEDFVRFGIGLIFIETTTGVIVPLALRLFNTSK